MALEAELHFPEWRDAPVRLCPSRFTPHSRNAPNEPNSARYNYLLSKDLQQKQ